MQPRSANPIEPSPPDRDERFNVLVGAATVTNGRFLLLKRSRTEGFLPEIWGIPAGKVDFNEQPEDAVLRELKEETGLSGHVVGLIGYSTFPSARGSTHLFNVQLNFLISSDDTKIKLDPSSHSDATWISIDDIKNSHLDDFTRSILKSARSLLQRSDAVLPRRD